MIPKVSMLSDNNIPFTSVFAARKVVMIRENGKLSKDVYSPSKLSEKSSSFFNRIKDVFYEIFPEFHKDYRSMVSKKVL